MTCGHIFTRETAFNRRTSKLQGGEIDDATAAEPHVFIRPEQLFNPA